MKLCDFCPIIGECERTKEHWDTRCGNPGAMSDIWKPMSEAVPMGTPILSAMLLPGKQIGPWVSVVTVFEGSAAVTWPLMTAFTWKAEEYVAWCDFTKLEITFHEK